MPGRPMALFTHDLNDTDVERLIARLSKSSPEWVQHLQRLLRDAIGQEHSIHPVPAGFKLSVVIPVYNERRWIGELVRRVEAVPIPKEILIIDDCSSDGTRE